MRKPQTDAASLIVESIRLRAELQNLAHEITQARETLARVEDQCAPSPSSQSAQPTQTNSSAENTDTTAQ